VTKRRITSDSALERYRAEWRESPPKRKKRVLAKALAYCSNHRLPDPAWLHDAIYQPARARVAGMKKTGRKPDLLSDGVLYDTVEDYLQNGCTEDLAFELTARDYDEELKAKSTKKPEDPGYADYLCKTVEKAWRRTKERIAHDNLPQGGEETGWRWKNEYLKNQRMWEEWTRDLPAYLKPKLK
jgi:hypothetical protein